MASQTTFTVPAAAGSSRGVKRSQSSAGLTPVAARALGKRRDQKLTPPSMTSATHAALFHPSALQSHLVSGGNVAAAAASSGVVQAVHAQGGTHKGRKRDMLHPPDPKWSRELDIMLRAQVAEHGTLSWKVVSDCAEFRRGDSFSHAFSLTAGG